MPFSVNIRIKLNYFRHHLFTPYTHPHLIKNTTFSSVGNKKERSYLPLSPLQHTLPLPRSLYDLPAYLGSKPSLSPLLLIISLSSPLLQDHFQSPPIPLPQNTDLQFHPNSRAISSFFLHWYEVARIKKMQVHWIPLSDQWINIRMRNCWDRRLDSLLEMAASPRFLFGFLCLSIILWLLFKWVKSKFSPSLLYMLLVKKLLLHLVLICWLVVISRIVIRSGDIIKLL